MQISKCVSTGELLEFARRTDHLRVTSKNTIIYLGTFSFLTCLRNLNRVHKIKELVLGEVDVGVVKRHVQARILVVEKDTNISVDVPVWCLSVGVFDLIKRE